MFFRGTKAERQPPMRGPYAPLRYMYMDIYTEGENELLTTKTTVPDTYTSTHINWYQYGELMRNI